MEKTGSETFFQLHSLTLLMSLKRVNLLPLYDIAVFMLFNAVTWKFLKMICQTRINIFYK
jgi:hypothetical protein